MGDPVVVDMAPLKELHALGGWDLVARIADTFARTGTKDLAAIEVASRELNFRELAIAAHKLKGSCASVGARRAAQLCFTLEQAGKGSTSEGVESAVVELRKAIDQTQETLRTLVAARSLP